VKISKNYLLAISAISVMSSSFAFDYESAYGKFGVVSGQPMQCEQVQKITQACIDSCNKDLSCIESCQNTSKMQVQTNNLKDCKSY